MSRAPRNDRELAEVRRTIRVDLLPTDLFRGETAAFDLVVDGMGLIGRWSQNDGTGGKVTWTTGRSFDTGACHLDVEMIAAAVRATIPIQIAKRPDSRRLLGHLVRRGAG